MSFHRHPPVAGARDVSRNRGARDVRGFTLIELMVTVALLGILLSIAVPSYERFLRGTRREDARHLLLLNAHRLRRCFTLVNRYDDDCHLRPASAEGYYRLEPTLESAGYSLRAVPAVGGPQARDTECGTLTYDQTGARGATGARGRDCW